MRRRGVRLTLVALFLIAAAGVGVTLYQGDRHAAAVRSAAREFDLTGQRAMRALGEVRAALQAAIVPGQDDGFWLPRAVSAIEATRVELASLKQRSTDGSVLNDLDAATAALDQVDEVRAESMRLLHNDLRTQASVAVLGRGAESLATASERIESARNDELARADGELAAARAYELLGSGVVFTLAVILIGLLMSAAGVEAEAAAGATEALTLTEAAHAMAAAEAPVRAKTGDETGTGRDAAPVPAPAPGPPPAVPEQAPAAAVAVPVDRRKAPELRAAADLCTDFARLVDAQELPDLLDRAARLLDASGFIVWVADPTGQHLRPTLAHGYAPAVLARLPAIARHADNATAAAYRHGEMQIVRTNGMSPGAIVVPILAPSGCLGAIAAEVRHGREASESMRALARIVAAQISTLLGATAEASAGGTDRSVASEGVASRQVG